MQTTDPDEGFEFAHERLSAVVAELEDAGVPPFVVTGALGDLTIARTIQRHGNRTTADVLAGMARDLRRRPRVHLADLDSAGHA